MTSSINQYDYRYFNDYADSNYAESFDSEQLRTSKDRSTYALLAWNGALFFLFLALGVLVPSVIYDREVTVMGSVPLEALLIALTVILTMVAFSCDYSSRKNLDGNSLASDWFSVTYKNHWGVISTAVTCIRNFCIGLALFLVFNIQNTTDSQEVGLWFLKLILIIIFTLLANFVFNKALFKNILDTRKE